MSKTRTVHYPELPSQGLSPTESTIPRASSATAHKKGGLKEFPATAICGNDITSSCLYVSALAIIQAGKWAWLALLMVAGVLFLYRKIYAEVVGALPLNGGAYNALLNTTSKMWASVAACLTVLSYMATAVISGSEAMKYAGTLWSPLQTSTATVMLLAAFALLTIAGITESSRVASAIFVFHLLTLTILLAGGLIQLAFQGVGTLALNFRLPAQVSFSSALFFGFAASMLGISGFESSANFVEEQAEGVFPRTLRNMWLAVSIFNPAIAFLALALVPVAEVSQHKETLLAHLGWLSGGNWLSVLISVDAALVLSGAVLTSFVGVAGLVKRMTLDRCLPQFLLHSNRRGTPHRIILGFFLISVSILVITEGELSALAGVYTISFLSVMGLFGVGNVLLKVKRARLPRPARASGLALFAAIGAVVAGLAGNAIMNPRYLGVFLEYFIPALLIVGAMLGRVFILKSFLLLVRSLCSWIELWGERLSRLIRRKIVQINSQQFVFFTRGDNLANLNRVMQYVQHNEHTNRIKVVTVVNHQREAPPKLPEQLQVLGEAYPGIHIEFVVEKGTFGPALIQQLSSKWNIPVNFMLIGSPGDHFLYGLADLGGVRLII